MRCIFVDAPMHWRIADAFLMHHTAQHGAPQSNEAQLEIQRSRVSTRNQVVAKQAHNPKVTGSNPVPATDFRWVIAGLPDRPSVHQRYRAQLMHF
jgi:hypothetical protein